MTIKAGRSVFRNISILPGTILFNKNKIYFVFLATCTTFVSYMAVSFIPVKDTYHTNRLYNKQ
jgi:hypothetical protein